MYFKLLTALAGLLMCASYAAAFPIAYITNLGDSTVSVIDTKNNAYVTKIPLGDGQQPYGVAVSSDGKRVFVSNQTGNSISVIDALTDVTNPTVISTINLGSVSPRGIAINAAGTRLYVTNFGAASVSVYDIPATLPSTLTPTAIASPTVGNNPTGITINSAGTYAYVTNFGSATVSVIDMATNTTSGSAITVGTNPLGIAIGNSGAAAEKIYVANKGDANGSVSVLDATTRAPITTITGVGSNPYAVAVAPDGSSVYVTNALGDSVVAINTTTNAIITSYAMPTGSMPQGIAVSPDGLNLYAVTYRGDDNKGSVATIRLSDGAVGYLKNQPDSINPDFVNFFNAPHSLGNFIGPQLYTITTTAGSNGTVTSPAPESKVATNGSTISQIVKKGATAVYAISPSTQYRVNSITIDGTPIVLNSDPQYNKVAQTLTLTGINDDKSLDVTFIKDFDYVTIARAPAAGALASADGTVTSTVGTNGSINCSASQSPTLCNALFQEGTTVTLTATPNTGYYFAGWVGTTSRGENGTVFLYNGQLCDGNKNPVCTFTMSTYTQFTATFTDKAPYDHIQVTTNGIPSHYADLQVAFNATNTGTSIVKLYQTPLTPHVAANLTTGASFILSGGWASPDYPSQSTTPTPINTLTITSGTITAEYIAIQ